MLVFLKLVQFVISVFTTILDYKNQENNCKSSFLTYGRTLKELKTFQHISNKAQKKNWMFEYFKFCEY